MMIFYEQDAQAIFEFEFFEVDSERLGALLSFSRRRRFRRLLARFATCAVSLFRRRGAPRGRFHLRRVETDRAE